MAMMVFLMSPDVDVLGLTMVTGNAWRDEEVAHTLRMLELIGRTDVPVVPGRFFRWCVRKMRRGLLQMYGKVIGLARGRRSHRSMRLPVRCRRLRRCMGRM